MSFPKGFIWGAAISSNQYEGAYNQGGKGLTALDVTTAGSRANPRKLTCKNNKNETLFLNKEDTLPSGFEYAVLDDVYYPNHNAVDGYHRYKEDIKLFGRLGINMLRVSIAWTRIFPSGEEEKPNKEGLSFYKDFFKCCKKQNIKLMVTLSHFDMPLNLETKGGWKNRDTIDCFIEYASVCLSYFKDDVDYWLVFNEINHPLQFIDMFDSPQDKAYQDVYQSLHHQFIASALVTKMAHEINPNNKVGCMICGITWYPMTCDPIDTLKTEHSWEKNTYYCGDVLCKGKYPAFAERLWKKHIVNIEMCEKDKQILLEGKVDFYSFSYYNSQVVTSHKVKDEVKGNFSAGARNEYLEYSEWGWACDPTGLQIYLEKMNDRYEMPLFVVENGLGAIDKVEGNSIHDQYRIEYISKHIEAIKSAIENNVNVKGYLVWSAIDIVSGGTGEMLKRYGLIYVDVGDKGDGTFNRYPKDSFYWYKKVIESNGEDLD